MSTPDESKNHLWIKIKAHLCGTAPFPTWTGLKRLGATPAMKATAMMPVLGYLILIQDQVTFKDAFWINISGSDPVDVGWFWLIGPWLMAAEPYRLYLLYFGLTALGVGALIFGWRCPHEIRDYSDRIAFIQSRLDNSTGLRRAEFLTYAIEHADSLTSSNGINHRGRVRVALQSACVAMVSRYDDAPGERTGYASATAWFLKPGNKRKETPDFGGVISLSEAFTDLCSRLHQARNVEQPLVRLTLRTLWTLGFALLAIPSLYAFLAVITVMLWETSNP